MDRTVKVRRLTCNCSASWGKWTKESEGEAPLQRPYLMNIYRGSPNKEAGLDPAELPCTFPICRKSLPLHFSLVRWGRGLVGSQCKC